MGEEVKENPVEEALDNGLNDLVRSMSSIHDHVRNITNTQLGNYSVVIDADIKTPNKDITYDNLMEKIKMAKNKIKEIQSKVSSTMADLESNWPKANITRQLSLSLGRTRGGKFWVFCPENADQTSALVGPNGVEND